MVYLLRQYHQNCLLICIHATLALHMLWKVTDWKRVCEVCTAERCPSDTERETVMFHLDQINKRVCVCDIFSADLKMTLGATVFR